MLLRKYKHNANTPLLCDRVLFVLNVLHLSFTLASVRIMLSL